MLNVERGTCCTVHERCCTFRLGHLSQLMLPSYDVCLRSRPRKTFPRKNGDCRVYYPHPGLCRFTWVSCLKARPIEGRNSFYVLLLHVSIQQHYAWRRQSDTQSQRAAAGSTFASSVSSAPVPGICIIYIPEDWGCGIGKKYFPGVGIDGFKAPWGQGLGFCIQT